MKNLTLLLLLLATSVYAQEQFNSATTQLNNLLTSDRGLSIGGYGEITYNNKKNHQHQLKLMYNV